MPLLIDAIKQRRYKKIQLGLHLGWDLNQRDPEQLRTPLIELTFLENEAIAACLCKRFLLAGARPDYKDITGKNALHWACEKSREKLVEILLREWNEYDINAQDREGNTALSLAVISNNEKIVRKLIEMLLRYNLSVDLPNKNGETPLILASKSRCHFLCEILRNVGRASTEMRDNVKQLNAKEWASLKAPVERPVSSSCDNSAVRAEPWQNKCSSRRPESVRKNYKSEMYKIFSLYYDEISSSFRQSAIPPPKEEENSDSATCYENGDDYLDFSVNDLATCSVTSTRSGRKRFSISRAAQVPITVNRMRRTKNTWEEGKSQNLWMGKQENCKLNASRKSIIPKPEATTTVPVIKRNSCPILRRRRTVNNNDEMFRLESLPESIEQE